MGKSPEFSPSLHASYCVTVVGSTPVESKCIQDALNGVVDSLKFELRCTLRASDSSFRADVVHAIVFTPGGIAQAMPPDVEAVRAATKPGTCRAYLLVCSGTETLPTAGLLDDFIQRTPTHTPDEIADQIIRFFQEVDNLNRRSTRLAFRDLTCWVPTGSSACFGR